MSASFLEVAGVTLRYGSNVALDDVTVSVAERSVHAVIGPNGAGKSTLFGAISGQHRYDSGSITLRGKRLPSRPHECARMGVVKAFQVARIFPSMTVEENMELALVCARGKELRFWSGIARTARRADVHAGVERVGLADQLTRTAGTLSQGDRKRLEIGLSLARGAALVLLDEPTAGMSAEETALTVDLVRKLHRDEGVTVLITEHDMEVVYGLADRITVLNRGGVLITDLPEVVRADKRVLEVYMGMQA